MATTLTEISRFLDERNWKYKKIPEQPCLLLGVRTQSVENFAVVIKLSEEGRYVKFQAPQLLEVKDHVYMGLFFRAMSNISFSVKMLRLQYDQIDGEISASVELPLEDSSITEKQFYRCLDGLINLVDCSIPRLKEVLTTGNDPGQRNVAEQLWDAIPTAMQKQLREIIRRETH